MRFALALLVALAPTVLVACGSDDDTKKATPATLSQQMLKAEDAPGSKPDPVETPQMTVKFDEFIQGLGENAIDPDTKEMTAVFKKAGFKAAGTETRFYGKKHTFDPRCRMSSVRSFSFSLTKGRRAPWTGSKPTPESHVPISCAVQISEFDVDDIPDARGIRQTQPPRPSRGSETQTNGPSTATGWASPTVHPSTPCFCRGRPGPYLKSRH